MLKKDANTYYRFTQCAGQDSSLAGNHTLLCKFILNKKLAHVEPERSKTPKGDPIGFSYKKYLASLYMMTDMPHVDIARELKIKHGVLRVWRTERETFLKEIEKHCKEFAGKVIDFVEAKADSLSSEAISKKGGTYKIEEQLSALADSNIFSRGLIDAISDEYILRLHRIQSSNRCDINELRRVIFFIHSVQFFIRDIGTNKDVNLARELKRTIILIHHNFIKSLKCNKAKEQEANLLLKSFELYIEWLMPILS